MSILVPAYNAAATVGNTLDSALAQSHGQLEVIVVDDGSTDGTAEVVESVDDRRLRLVRQDNRGQCAALNRAAAEASGDYFKFLDADDWLNPGHIASQLAVLEGSRDLLASCRWGYFVEDPRLAQGRAERTNRDYDDPLEWIVDSLTLDEGMMGGWMWLIPRPVWERSGGWDERLSLNNDFDFSIRLLLASDGVRFAPEALYAYRKGVSGALSGSGGSEAMRSAFLTTEAGCRALLEREDSPRVRRVCADRWQRWLHLFYPEYPELAAEAEARVASLGGSSVTLEGGALLRGLLPVLGWKLVRRLQVLARRLGWQRVLRWKARRRIREIEHAS